MADNDPRNTIPDGQWRRLQDRAHRANPSSTDRKAVDRRKAASENKAKSRQN